MRSQLANRPDAAAEPDTVSSAELVRRFGVWQERASRAPLYITHHGRRRLVMVGLDRFRALCAPQRQSAGDGDAEIRLATLFDQLPQGFVAFDDALRLVAANAAALLHLRMARDALIGQTLGEATGDLGRTVAAIHIARTAWAGDVAAFDAPSMTHPGVWLRFRIFPYGEGVGCLFHSVTAEREAEEASATHAALRDALAEQGLTGHARLSPRGTFAAVDPVLARLAGFAAESLLMVRLTDILPLHRRIAAAAEVEAVLSGGGTRAFDSALLVNRGEERPVRIALAPLHGHQPADGAVVVVTVHPDEATNNGCLGTPC